MDRASLMKLLLFLFWCYILLLLVLSIRDLMISEQHSPGEKEAKEKGLFKGQKKKDMDEWLAKKQVARPRRYDARADAGGPVIDV